MSKLNRIELVPDRDHLLLIMHVENDMGLQSKIRFKYDSGVEEFYKLLATEIKSALPVDLK